jgi:hypothetical protein
LAGRVVRSRVVDVVHRQFHWTGWAAKAIQPAGGLVALIVGLKVRYGQGQMSSPARLLRA